ncbi:MAG: P1 family peptidase, partial [Haliea sp.]|nr:P1 family peptidase [Haliea sp.]
ANTGAVNELEFNTVTLYPNYQLATVFRAAVDATEEAIVNAMVAAETMVGTDGLKVEALPHADIKALFASP